MAHAPEPVSEPDGISGLLATTGHLPRSRLGRAAGFERQLRVALGLRWPARCRRNPTAGSGASTARQAHRG
jgi:hypothetical protein